MARTFRPWRRLAAAALGVPLAVLPTAVTPAAAGPPWWCAPDAVLAVDALPDVLPVSACALDGRAVVGARGFGAEVPAVGHGVAAVAELTDGAEVVTVFTDEYGVHVRGGPIAAAYGYLGTLRDRAAAPADLDRMARAVRRVTVESIGRVRPLPLTAARLLDAGDALVAAYAGSGGDPAAARETLASYLGVLVARTETDDAPSIGELSWMAADVRAVLRTGTVDVATADRALAETAMLRAYLDADVEIEADPSAAEGFRDAMADLVGGLRAAIAHGGTTVDAGLLSDPFGAQLAALAQYLGDATAPLGVPGLPGTPGPDVADPTGTVATTSPPPCEDGARAALYPEHPHFPVGTVVKWWYQPNNNPGYYSTTAFAATAHEAFSNITALHDDCGYDWDPKLANQYMGVAQQTGPGTDGEKCVRDTDRVNVVGWRTVTSDDDATLAFACVWHYSTTILGADVAVGRQWKWDMPEYDPSFGYPACTPYDKPPQPDYEAVMTHEFGHVAGLGHVAEVGHGRLTMSTTLNGYCQRSERTPGRGDAIGLGNLYGRNE